MDNPRTPSFPDRLARLQARTELLREAEATELGALALQALSFELAHEAELLAAEARAYAGKFVEESAAGSSATSQTAVVEEVIWSEGSSPKPIASDPASSPAATEKRSRRKKADDASAPPTAAAPVAPSDPAAALSTETQPIPASGPSGPTWVTTPDGKPHPAAAATVVPHTTTTPAPAPSEPKRMTGPDRLSPAPPAPTEDAVAAARASIVSPDAERVLKEAGDAARASDARRAAEAKAKAQAEPPAQDAPTPAEPAVSAPVSAETSRAIPPEPEDAVLPFRQGPFQNVKLSACTIEQLETLVVNYVKNIPGDSDPDSRAIKSSWLERVLRWHRYKLESFLAKATPEALGAQVFLYEQLLQNPHAVAAVHEHRKIWLAIARSWKQIRESAAA
jgi:hypothetical protein